MSTQMDVWLNLDLFQGKTRNKDRSKVPKVSGLVLMSEAKKRYRDGRKQQFLKFVVSGLLYVIKNYEDSQRAFVYMGISTDTYYIRN